MTRFGIAFLVIVGSVAAKDHQLKPTPKTVVWGYHDATTPPALRIQSGDTVEMETAMIASPEMLTSAGLPASQVQASDRLIHEQVKERGPGPHSLTGPVYVEGAEPGDTLEVRILSVDFVIPYSLILFEPGLGLLPEDFPYERIRVIPLDLKRNVAPFAKGVEVPLRPFFGSMGLVPPANAGRVSSSPPWVHAGNMDNKELVAGTTLYLPVHVRGGLFLTGDGHAAQGDGEVCLAALETALRGKFQFVVHKGRRLLWPRIETSTHYITMGLDPDLDKAAKLAVRDMVDFLVTQKGLSRDDAYMLCSTAADLHVTQVVDGTQGVHAMLPKTVFVQK